MASPGARKPAPAEQAARAEAAESTGTVHRVVRLISAVVSSGEDVGVADLSQRLALPIPTIHRLLHLLRDEGVIDWNPSTHKYSIGAELFRISAQVSSAVTIPSIAQGEIDELSRATGETILFGAYQVGMRTMSFAARAEGTHPLQYRIQMHTPLSLVWGASGKAILAYLPDEVAAQALEAERDDAQNGSAPPTLAQLSEDLERVRRAGFAVSEGEKLLGARGIAAPVFGVNGVVGSICITSPRERIPLDRIMEFGELARQSARNLSHTLGARLSD